jgi:sugar fermentation stimulation protein A
LYKFPALYKGRLISRYKRFFADVETADGVITCHNPNTGSMRSLLNRDGERRKVLYSKSDSPKRKLPYTLEAVKVDHEWVISNTLRANRIAENAFMDGELPLIYGGGEIRREFPIGDSRIDFLLDGQTLVEVKSVTYFDGSACFFPDAPTERGRKQLRTLDEAANQGYRAIVLYICMVRRDAFRIAEDIDPEYAAAVKRFNVESVPVYCDFKDGTAHLCADFP